MRNHSKHVVHFLISLLLATSVLAGTLKPTGHAIDGEVVVKIRAGASANDISGLEKAADADESQKVAHLRSGTLWRLHSRSKKADAIITALQKNPHVEYAEPNYILRLLTSPNDPSYSQLYGLKNTGQSISSVAGFPGADIDAEAAWGITTGSSSIVIGVVDTGIDYNHPDLAANMWSNPGGKGNVACAAGTHGFNAITDTCDPMDDYNHGTHVAGTIGAAGNNALGVAGVNWTTSIMSLKFISSAGYGTTANAIKAIDFAVQAKIDGVNVRVLSNSWGGGAFSKSLLDVINEANEHDILFIASAGNDTSNNDSFPKYPASYATPNMIAVAATDNRDTIAWFSNYGATTVHLGAPGVNVLSTVIGGGYSMYSGTSMAAPHVSGVAGLVLAQTPGLTTAQVKSAILNNTDPISSLTGKTITGGRLNAARALGVPAGPDFAISVSPSLRLVQPGGSTTYTITITPSNGFNGNVDLSLSGAPSGVSGTFSPNPVTTTSTLIVTASASTYPSSYALSVVGVGGGEGHSKNMTLSVTTASVAACPAIAWNNSYGSSSPAAVAIGDFNRDGNADLVTANVNSSRVTIHLGSAAGYFSFGTQATVGSTPLSIATGDFNRDGKLDLAVANSGANNVSILLGNGDGTFQSAVNYAAGSTPFSVAAGDLNGDGKLDLAVANNASGNVSILLGQGDGTFAAAVHSTIGSGPFWVAIGDLDRDGKADVAAANYNDGTVSVLLGNGDGTLDSAVDYDAATGSSSVAIADVDLDGNPDLAVANYGANNVSVLAGNGDGTFDAAVHYAVGSGPYSVAAGDFNGDGFADLVTSNSNSNNMSLLLADGTGAFTAATHYVTGTLPNQAAVGDLNGDNRPDVAVVELGYSYLSVYLNNSTCSQNCGTLAAAVQYGAGTTPSSLAAGDFNGDGRLDLAVANKGSNNVSLGLGTGTGTFGSGGTVTVGTSPEFIAVGDFNRDGDDDLATANSGSNNVSIALGNGNATFQSAAPYSVGTAPRAIAIGDFDRDGDSDLAVSNHDSDNVSILLGNGNGTFAAAVPYAMGTDPNGIATGDLNRDGRLDLVVAAGGSAAMSILLGNGDGTFQAATSTGAGTTPLGISIADLDRDGKLDLVVANSGYNTVSTHRGNGDGTFQPAVHYTVVGAGVDPRDVITGDFNDDGLLDLAVINAEAGGLMILAGTNSGEFTLAGNYATGGGSVDVLALDLNRDGKLDFVTANGTAATVSVLRNTCPLQDLTITKTHSGNFTQGATGKTYTITVTNSGGAATSGTVTVKDTLPLGLAATAMAGTGWTCTLATLTCTRNDALAAGASYPAITLTVKVSSSAPASLTNTVVVSGGGELNSINSTASDPTTITQITDIVITKSHSGNFTQGATGRIYTIIVRNAGGLATSGTVTVTDTLPAGLTATAISGSGWSCTLATRTCTRSDVLAAQSNYPAITVTVNVAANAAANVTNTATVSGGSDSNTDNNTVSDPTVIWSNQTCGSFGAAVYYNTQYYPRSLAIADFNGDGKTDIAAAHDASNNNVSVLLNNGNGTFGAATSYSGAATYLRAIATGDLNRDGKADLVTLPYYGSSVSVLLGNGDGTFGASTSYSTTGEVKALALSDFNDDGNPDVAVITDYSPGTLTILLGNGNGSLQAPVAYSTIIYPAAITVADFDLDGARDIVVANDYGNWALFTGNGDGTFADDVTFTSGGSGVSTGDFNRDGKPDLAFLQYYEIEIRLGNGDGTFQPAVSYSLPYSASAIAIEDISGDGIADIVGGGYSAITILRGNADGTFQTASGLYGVSTNDVEIGDFNNDGKADLAITNYGSVGVMMGGCPDLTITKTHNGTFSYSSSGQYSIVVNNSGAGSSVGTVTVTDNLPNGLTASSMYGYGWNCTLATLTCTTNYTLQSGNHFDTIYLTVQVSPSAPSSVTNTATVSGGSDSNTSNNVASDPTTIVPSADLAITKTHTGTFVQGETGKVYTITVSNVGNVSSTGTVTVTESIPYGLTLTSMTGNGWICTLNQPYTSPYCQRSDALAPNASYPPITATVNVNVNSPSTVSNSVSVYGGGEIGSGGNNYASDMTKVLTAPYGMTATAATSTLINVTWPAVAHATGYRVLRSSNHGPFTLVATVPSPGLSDGSVVANTTYVYLVQPLDNAVVGPSSNPDLATTIFFTDDPLTNGSTKVRAVHLTELRTAVNAVRTAAGLAPATFTDASLAGKYIKTVHITELRTRLNEARSALGLVGVAFTDATLTVGSTPIKAAHVYDLRNGVR